jgi:hypothetical protein
MAGLVPAIHVFVRRGIQDVDARDKRGHDGSIKFHPATLRASRRRQTATGI